ncbi:MAG: hypothetical protein NTW76_20610 [Corynebacteriales bacterium]|uniref:Uncharacterized protein n=1 Tax=Williamsia herbipolensis TaxID=1603258 RepID=A0AAU4K4M2_9NOCA|nr:hypothetical protein [Williamsia herbipolensis]MCX6471693.1 hypothetical protein [Mycobacteriales bacterium]
MTPAVRIGVGVIVAIGLLEMALSSIAALAGMSSWSQRFTELTRIEPSPSLRLGLGIVAGVAAVSLAVGFARPTWFIVGGVLLTADAGAVLVRQLYLGDSGSSLIPYALFTACGLVAIGAGALTR